MRMQKSTRILLSSITSASILVLAACQPSGINAPQTSQVVQVNQKLTPNPVVKKPQLKSNVSDRPVFGQAVVDGKKKEIKLTIQYPEPEGFKTQALGCNPFDSFEVKVEGIGLTPPIYADGADATTNRINATPGNCQFTALISNVPIGNGRVITVKAYDSGGNPLVGTELLAPVNITDGVSTNAELSYKTYPAGLVLAEMMGHGASGITPSPHAASKVNIDDLQTLINGITAVTGSFPAYGYPSAHPYLVNVVAIANDLIASNGDVSALNAANPAYVLAGQSISVDISGATATDSIDVIVRDPVSAANAGNLFVGPTDTITVNGLPPGTWPVTVVNTSTSSTVHVNIAAGTTNVPVNFSGTSAFTQTAGPVSVYVNTLFHAGEEVGGATPTPGLNEVYIGTRSGIFKTTDITSLGTNDWIDINGTGLTDRDVRAIAINPANLNEIIIGTATGGIFRTTDAGVNWSPGNVGFCCGTPQINDLIWEGSELFAATEDAFWKTNTGAAPNWSPSMDTDNNVIPDPGFRGGTRFSREAGNTFWAIVPTTGGAITGGAFRTNFGQVPGPHPGNWNNINAGTTAVTALSPIGQFMSIHAVNTGEVYVGTGQGKILSYDNTTWTDVSGGLPSEEISKITNNATNYFAGTFGEGVYHHSGTPAGSWTLLGTALENTMIKDIDVSTAVQIFASTKGGVFSHSGTTSTNWVSHNTQMLRKGGISDLHLDLNDNSHNTLYAAVDSDGIHKTTDGGNTWFRLDFGGGLPVFIDSVASDPGSDTVYAGTPGIGVWRSNTGGNANWVQLNSGVFLNSINAVDLHVEDEGAKSFVYAATGGGTPGLLKAEVGNETNNFGILSTQEAYSVAVDPNDPAIVYTGDQNGVIYKSVNATNALAAITFNGGVDIDAAFTGTVTKIVVHPLDSDVIYAVTDSTLGSGAGSIFASTDGGVSWGSAMGTILGDSGATGTDTITSFAIDPNNVNTIYAGLQTPGGPRVMKNTSGGSGTWTNLDTSLGVDPKVLVTKPAPSTEMFMGTAGSSVWKRSL